MMAVSLDGCVSDLFFGPNPPGCVTQLAGASGFRASPVPSIVLSQIAGFSMQNIDLWKMNRVAKFEGAIFQCFPEPSQPGRAA